ALRPDALARRRVRLRLARGEAAPGRAGPTRRRDLAQGDHRRAPPAAPDGARGPHAGRVVGPRSARGGPLRTREQVRRDPVHPADPGLHLLTRSRTMGRVRLLAVAGLALAALVPAAPATGQSDETAGYDYFNLHALADGVTASFNLQGFLPIEDLV